MKKLTPDEASAAACACDLYADEFCLEDQAEADDSGAFGPREQEWLLAAAKKLAAGGVPNFHPAGCDCGHEWCRTRRALDKTREAVLAIHAATPNYGSAGCECGPHGTPWRECPVHWAIWILEGHDLDYHEALAALASKETPGLGGDA